MTILRCIWLDEIAYSDALALQNSMRTAVLNGEETGVLLLLTHPPTFTLGRHGNDKNVLVTAAHLKEAGAVIHRVDRGGDVTFHGPGQLVGYPIVNLEKLRLGVRDYICGLSRSLSRAVARWGIDAYYDDSAPGLWVGQNKLAAFGVHVHRRVTTHGFSLNVATNLNWYKSIVPCGLSDRGVTSMADLLGDRVPEMHEVRTEVESAFKEVFSIDFEYNADSAVIEKMHKESY